MHHPHPVGGVERLTDLPDDAHQACHRDRPLQGELSKGLAGEVLHHAVDPASGLFHEVVNLDDVLVTDPVDRPRLLKEALQLRAVGGELFLEDLDRHLAIQLGVAGEVDAPHSPLANQLLQLVATEHLAGRSAQHHPLGGFVRLIEAELERRIRDRPGHPPRHRSADRLSVPRQRLPHRARAAEAVCGQLREAALDHRRYPLAARRQGRNRIAQVLAPGLERIS